MRNLLLSAVALIGMTAASFGGVNVQNSELATTESLF